MKKRVAVIMVLAALAMLAPPASAEPDLPYGYDSFVIYFTGTCGVSATYHGFYEQACNGHHYYGGTRSGQWRHIAGDNCDYPYDSFDIYEVCTNGTDCTDANGTWVEITQAQFEAYYCP